MISFVQCECEKSLELEIDQIQMIKKSASNIVSAVCDFMSKNKSQGICIWLTSFYWFFFFIKHLITFWLFLFSEDSAETEEKIKELAFVKADEIRGRCLSPLKKCTELVVCYLIFFIQAIWTILPYSLKISFTRLCFWFAWRNEQSDRH